MSFSKVPSPPALDPDVSGPEYWAKQRAQWLQPSPDPVPTSSEPSEPPENLERLVALMDEPGAERNDAYWHGGLQRVWKGLVSSAVMKHPLPLRTATKLLHSGWIRDGTWPKNAVVPSSSDDEPSSHNVFHHASASGSMSANKT